MVTVIKNWKMVESSVEEGPNVPENAWKMVIPQYRLTLRCLRSCCTYMNRKVLGNIGVLKSRSRHSGTNVSHVIVVSHTGAKHTECLS